MDMEMLERVASAIFNTDDFPATTHYQRVAINAIKAMREPTKKMLTAENVHTKCHTCGGHKEGYQAMIDAVIKYE